MKTTTLVLILFLTALGLWAQTPPTLTPAQMRQLQLQRLRALTNNAAGASAGAPATDPANSMTTPDASANSPGSDAAPGGEAAGYRVQTGSEAAPGGEAAGYKYNFPGVDVGQVLDIYSDLVGRTLIRGQVPQASITLKTQSPLTKTEAIEALQAVLALNGITLINIGDKFVKVLPPDQAAGGGGSLDSTDAEHLPPMGSYITHIVQLQHVKPSAMAPLIQPFGRLPNSISPIDDNGILVIRDYAENVKRMLEMIARIDISVPAEYISAVIPIRYAQADDIANALNSLGGSGGATVSVGGSTTAPPISGVAGNRGGGAMLGGMGGTTTQPGVNPAGSALGQQRPGVGATAANPNGTPSSNTPFQRRLLNIINQAGGAAGEQQPIQIFGQAKIIADERSNSLLIYATRQDMDAITNVIGKLDVLLSQVLIQSVIIDYSLGPNTLNVGVSASQEPLTGTSVPLSGAGGYNNGQQFYNFLNRAANLANTNGVFGNGLGGGLSYFGNIGNSWNVALSAAAADSHASIIQTPSIQTSQAKPAQFFVGDTVPYVTSTYNYGGAYGNQSSYAQLSVGVELDVTPFINPDGLVVMDINQEIDDLNGYTTITGVGQIPNTIKRTLNSEITVSNQDTVVLGAFIKNSKSTSRSGVPLLQDIPLLGGLFSQRNNSKQREELIVLMQPTVLRTPEIAAVNTVKLEQRLPGVERAAYEDAAEESKLNEAERKKELKNPVPGVYGSPIPTNAPSQPQVQSRDFFSPIAPQAPVIPANNNNAAPPTP
jgi:general secretion pathway protein D